MIALIRGGGDLATGVALRLFRVGFQVVITELEKPLAIRRKVSFAESVYTREVVVENITAQLVQHPPIEQAIRQVMGEGKIAVVVDPQGKTIDLLSIHLLIDARMLKEPVPVYSPAVDFVIGLGPGFTAGVNGKAVIETQRGHTLGRVYWQGSGLPDSGLPDGVKGFSSERVLRAPNRGNVDPKVDIGAHLEPGQLVAEVSGIKILAPFKGVLRGLIHPTVVVEPGTKVGDVDPRDDPKLCELVSDKSLAVGGGVLEAILTKPELRQSFLDF